MLTGAKQAAAVEIGTGNPDTTIRWDNSLRYNLGVRTQKQDSAIVNTVGYANSDLKFDKGDIITNRVDLLSEFDLVYKKTSGIRVSGQAWVDAAYNRDERINPALGAGSAAYPDQRYTDYTARWNRGPSGEFLDAFVFTQFNLADTTTDVKLGSHNLYWGESLFSFVHGVSYSQGPVDLRKALATPGIEAKELFKPLAQLSAATRITDTFSVGGQYFLDWKPSTLPDGGTYYGALDFITAGGGTYVLNPIATGGMVSIPFAGSIHDPERKHGDWGLMAKWSPQALDGTLGVYYRRYTDKLPQIASSKFLAGGIPESVGLDYLSKRVTLVGLSLSKSVGGVAIGAEVAHRSNTGLLMGPATTLGAEPVGDTWHALVNAVAYVGKNAVFDSAAILGELTYSKLGKVKSNPQNFNSVDYGCAGQSAQLGCATDYSLGFAVKFEPKWFQVREGLDLSVPVFYSKTLKGTSPVLFGGYEGAGAFSVGLTADYLNKHNFALAYNGTLSKRTIVAGKVVDVGGIGAQWDRGNVTLTYKVTF